MEKKNEILNGKDADMNFILNYKSIPYESEHLDGGYAIRTIEIYCFSKIKKLCEKFKLLTGYDVPYTVSTVDEINRLVKRGLEICHTAKKNFEESTALLTNVEQQISRSGQDRGKEFKGLVALRAHIEDLQDNKRRIESEMKAAHVITAQRRRLLGLLRPEVERMSAENLHGLTPKILSLVPAEMLTENSKSSGYFEKSEHPIDYAWREMKCLENAIKNIVNLCTLPTDKFDLGHGGKEKAEYYREYYSIESENVRSTISASIYVNEKYERSKKNKHKLIMMNFPI